MRPVNTHNDGYLQMKKPGTDGCQALVNSGKMAVTFRKDSAPVQTDAGDWLLLADKQPSYGDVRSEYPGIVEQSDGTTGYRDTGVIPPLNGYIELGGRVRVTGPGKIDGIVGDRFYFGITSGVGCGGVGSVTYSTLRGTTNFNVGDFVTLRMEWDANDVRLIINGVLEKTVQRSGDPSQTDTILLYAVANSSNFIRAPFDYAYVEIGDVNGTPFHRWTASNMYYDQIGNASTVSNGILTQVSHPLGDQTFNERGYRINGNELIPAKLDGTAAADGQPLTYGGRAPHSVLLPSYSGSGPIVNELMQFTDDGPLDQYLAGSGAENGQQFTFADVIDTANVITTSNGFSVWKTAPSVQSILEELC